METQPYDFEAHVAALPSQTLSPAVSTAPTLYFTPMKSKSPEEIPPTQPSPESPAEGVLGLGGKAACHPPKTLPKVPQDFTSKVPGCEAVDAAAVADGSKATCEAEADAPPSQQTSNLGAFAVQSSEQNPDPEKQSNVYNEQIPNLKTAAAAATEQTTNLKAPAGPDIEQTSNLKAPAGPATEQTSNMNARAGPVTEQITNLKAPAALVDKTTLSTEAPPSTPLRPMAVSRCNSSTPLSGPERTSVQEADVQSPPAKMAILASTSPAPEAVSQVELLGGSGEDPNAAGLCSPRSAMTDDLLEMKALLHLQC